MTRAATAALFALLTALPAHAQNAGVGAGDPAAGEGLWRQCRSCHMVSAPDGNVILRGGGRGPNLYALADRPVAAEPGFRYSPALAALGATGATWTAERFAAFAANPTAYLREALGDTSARSEMGYQLRGGNAEDLWAYLNSLTRD